MIRAENQPDSLPVVTIGDARTSLLQDVSTPKESPKGCWNTSCGSMKSAARDGCTSLDRYRQTHPAVSLNRRLLQGAKHGQARFTAMLMRAVVAKIRAEGDETLIAIIDGKPLPVGGASGDPEARCGRGAGLFAKGYKLFTVWGGRPAPEAFRVYPMNKRRIRSPWR